MPKLKCIGGAADGEWGEIHENFSIGEIVHIPARIEFKIVEFDLQEALKQAVSNVPYYVYKICVLQYKDISGFKQSLYYLIPQNWHEWEAMRYLFRCHTSYG